MTLVEYLEVNKMTQVELAKLTGVPVESINRYINHGGGFSPKYTHALRTVGIDIKNKREREINGFDQFKFSVQYTLNATLILRTKEKGRLMGLISLSFRCSTRLMRQRKLM